MLDQLQQTKRHAFAKKANCISTAFNFYSVIREVGEGGSGRVFQAKDTNGTVVAIKSLHPYNITGDRVKRFKNETHFCLRSPHQNIVTVLDYGMGLISGKQCPFYVMPFYSGTLRTLINGRIPPAKTVRYFVQILDGIEAAHLSGVWHRDLKPENILFDPDSDRLVIADFGIARFVKETLHTLVETKPNARLANFQYAAPEQRTKGQTVDQRADIFSLGLILNEMFTNQIIQGTAFNMIGTLVPDFGYLDALVDHMVRQEPAQRPSSINEIKESLIARGNEFVSRQRLNDLKTEVVSQNEIDDPLVVDPPRITNVDYHEGDLVFTLSREPTVAWEYSLRSISGYPILLGNNISPQSVRFRGRLALVDLPSEGNAQAIIDIFKTYIRLANKHYADEVTRHNDEEEQNLRDKLKKKIEEEERRARILGRIQL